MLELNLERLEVKTINKRSIMKNFILCFEISLHLLALICFFYFLANGFKAKAFKCVIIIILLLGYRFLQIVTSIKLHDVLKLSVLIFIFMAMFLAEILNFYSRIPIFDKILHSSSGAMLFFVGQALFRYLDKTSESYRNNNNIMIVFSMFFSIAMAGCWEIFEFSLDRLMGYHLQNGSLIDTMQDIICGTTVAILTGVCLFLFKMKKTGAATVYTLAASEDEEPSLVIMK